MRLFLCLLSSPVHRLDVGGKGCMMQTGEEWDLKQWTRQNACTLSDGAADLEHRLPACCVSDLSIGFCENAKGINSMYKVPQHPLLKTCSFWRNAILCIGIYHVISDQVSSGVAKFSVSLSLPLAEAWRSLCGPSRCGQTQELQRKCFSLSLFDCDTAAWISETCQIAWMELNGNALSMFYF